MQCSSSSYDVLQNTYHMAGNTDGNKIQQNNLQITLQKYDGY